LIEQIRIRRMSADDLPVIMTIETSSYTVPWSEATFRGLLRRADADLVVAEFDGVPIGYACSWFVIDQGELGNVAVAEPWRNRGVGAKLVETVLERALERGAREMFLEVRPSNAAAQRLYEAFGFREVGRRRNYYAEPPEDALVMRRAVQPAAKR
jgi:ribosomal-protein-alanine N-acetyltransferase